MRKGRSIRKEESWLSGDWRVCGIYLEEVSNAEIGWMFSRPYPLESGGGIDARVNDDAAEGECQRGSARE